MATKWVDKLERCAIKAQKIVSDTHYVLGLDVGGTKIAAGVVAFPSGEVILKRFTPTLPKRNAREILNDAVALADDLARGVSGNGIRIGSVGIGVAELVDPRGCITSDQTIPWRDTPVAEAFAHLGPVVVESDVRACALAEAILGAGRAFRLFTYVAVGTGISHCLVQDQVPFAGARGNALILASAALTTTCTNCGAVVNEILEEVGSGPALLRLYNRRVQGTVAACAEDVVARAASGDSVAAEVVCRGGRALGNSVGFLVNVLDPEAVVVGGGLGLAGGLYWSAFETATREHIWSDTARDLRILPAALGQESGLIGAAAAAWKREGGQAL
jgi:glucokinase